jgi:hypothetical protein
MLNELKDDLKKRVDELLLYVFASLDCAVAGGVIGQVNWMGSNTCSFTHCLTEVHALQEPICFEHSTLTPRLFDDCYFHHRFKAFEHHILSARLVRGLPGESLVPERLRFFVTDWIPDFFRPLCLVIDGHLINSRIAEWDLFEPRKRKTYESKPNGTTAGVFAILLGPYVIAGWSGDELIDSAAGIRRYAARTWLRASGWCREVAAAAKPAHQTTALSTSET